MATASPSILPPVNLNDNFSVTVTIVPGALEIVSSVSGVLSGSPSEPITVSSGTTSVTISGKHQNTFVDVFTYTEKGETDLTQTPTIVTGIGNVPDKKNLYDLKQDLRKSEIRTYTLTVNGSQTLTVTQEVQNPLEVKRKFMANYNYNNHKGV
jgi:hypothetical protein